MSIVTEIKYFFWRIKNYFRIKKITAEDWQEALDNHIKEHEKYLGKECLANINHQEHLKEHIRISK